MLKSIFLVMAGFIFSGTALTDELMPQLPDAAATEATSTESTQEAMPQADATTEVAEEQSGFSRGSVMRSIFTNGIDNREPIDNMKSTGNNSNTITYFTELRDMSGQKAIHRWEHNGEVMAEVEFNVRGPRWRVWSSKSFIPSWEGEWKVSVLNAAGDVISEEMINYQQPEMASDMTAEPAMEPAGNMPTDAAEPALQDSPQQ